MGYICRSGYITHSYFGRVNITARSNAKRLIGRFQDGLLTVTVPKGLPLERLITGLDRWAGEDSANPTPIVNSATARPAYHVGQTIELEDFNISFKVDQNVKPGYYHCGPEGKDIVVRVGPGVEMTDRVQARGFTNSIEKLAADMYGPSLLTTAHFWADRLGCAVLSFTISRGRRVLGSCDRRRNIKLSRALVFYPAELRQYVICHELAHLNHPDHSPAFHACCDRYLDGREKELIAKLKAFKYPLFY